MSRNDASRRLPRASRARNTADATGKVRVTIVLVGDASRSHVRGNIVRTFTYPNTTVSAVAGRVERAV